MKAVAELEPTGASPTGRAIFETLLWHMSCV
jgi:hypothetical protein